MSQTSPTRTSLLRQRFYSLKTLEKGKAHNARTHTHTHTLLYTHPGQQDMVLRQPKWWLPVSLGMCVLEFGFGQGCWSERELPSAKFYEKKKKNEKSDNRSLAGK